VYKYKIRYVEIITDICLKLDDNNNQSIVAFILLSKSISLCNFVKYCLKLHKIFHQDGMIYKFGLNLEIFAKESYILRK